MRQEGRMLKWDDSKTGERVRQLRKEKGWSQEELANRCGVSLNFIGQIERGTRSMSLDTFAKLCTELETTADALLWGDRKPFEPQIQDIWGQKENKKESNYKMYVQIMQSVADALKGMQDCDGMHKTEHDSPGHASRNNGKSYEDHTNI